MVVKHDYGVIFSILASIIIIMQGIFGHDAWTLLLNSLVIIASCFFTSVYVYTFAISRPDINLLRIAASILLLDSIILVPIIGLQMSLLVVTMTLMGLILSFLERTAHSKREKRRYESSGERRSTSRKQDIEKELADPWREEPHIIYDPYELKKFDI